MLMHCFKRILGTRRFKPTATQRSKQHGLRGRKNELIRPCGQYQEVLGDIHEVGARSRPAIMARSTWRRISIPSRRFTDWRATSTTSHGGAMRDCRWRNASRNCRRARERTTAPPSLRLVTTPKREGPASGRVRQLRTTHPRTSRSPTSRVRRNSPGRCIRIDRDSRSRWDWGFIDGRATAYTGVRRLRPARRRRAMIARPLLLELRLRKPCWRFLRILEG